jgi:hypothetical protein
LPSWSNCKIEIFSGDGTVAWEDATAEVRLDEREIVVSYFDEDGPVVYVGRNRGTRRFDLACRSRARRATLERSADGVLLDGTWLEGDDKGTWKVSLSGEPDPDY